MGTNMDAFQPSVNAFQLIVRALNEACATLLG
jgi:hypothetical protein